MAQVHRHREETINTQLAIYLAKHGVEAESETIHQSGQQRPDVMFVLGGLRVIIEGKFGDTPDAQNVVLGDALKRVQTGICHIAVALVYPKSLRTVATPKLETSLSTSQLQFLIVSEDGKTDWAEASPTEILASLRRVHESLTKDDIVAESAKKLSDRIEAIAGLWANQPGTCDRLSTLLGMPAKRGETAEERDGRRETATKVASLVLANAMIFQEQLAASGGDGRVESLRAYDNAADPIAELKSNWHWIWTKINYVPIFQIGESILSEIPISQPAIAAIRWLMDEAKSICANQSALRHDLMGRIYHWLLHHAKYLGTYYTATSSATLLLKLVFSQSWIGQDFGSPRKLVDFAVSDLACGTGTLLMAAAQSLTDQFILARVQGGKQLTDVDLKHLHETLMENVLHGYDVLPSAVHLTASTLGMLAPSVTYRKMNLFVMPMGVQGRSLRLGSLDFIGHKRVPTQLALDNNQMEVKRTGIVAEHYTEAEVPTLDLCVMNPPFVRSVGGNLLFGSLPDDERAKLQTELKKRSKDLRASITAGLGSVFMAIADRHLRVGGRMAFILPIALATGEAWGESRKLLSEGYHLEMVIVSHDAERPNFSENTDLSELMFIARKLKKSELPGRTTYVNLWHNPRTIYEAMDIAERIRTCSLPASDDNVTVTSVSGSDGRKLAELVCLPPSVGSRATGARSSLSEAANTASNSPACSRRSRPLHTVGLRIARTGFVTSIDHSLRAISKQWEMIAKRRRTVAGASVLSHLSRKAAISAALMDTMGRAVASSLVMALITHDSCAAPFFVTVTSLLYRRSAICKVRPLCASAGFHRPAWISASVCRAHASASFLKWNDLHTAPSFRYTRTWNLPFRSVMFATALPSISKLVDIELSKHARNAA